MNHCQMNISYMIKRINKIQIKTINYKIITLFSILKKKIKFCRNENDISGSQGSVYLFRNHAITGKTDFNIDSGVIDEFEQLLSGLNT